MIKLTQSSMETEKILSQIFTAIMIASVMLVAFLLLAHT